MANKSINELLKYGGMVKNFIRPNLTNDGTMGGASFAVTASATFSSYYPWKAVKGYASTTGMWASGVRSTSFYFYNPKSIIVSSLSLTTGDANSATCTFPIYGSMDGVTYTQIGTTTYTLTGGVMVTSVANIASVDRKPYKYHRLDLFDVPNNGYIEISNLVITALELMT